MRTGDTRHFLAKGKLENLKLMFFLMLKVDSFYQMNFFLPNRLVKTTHLLGRNSDGARAQDHGFPLEGETRKKRFMHQRRRPILPVMEKYDKRS